MPVELNSGDTAWMLVSCALVMLMVLGLGFFYAGMVQTKNVLSTLSHSLGSLSLVTVQWGLFGFSLAFGSSHAGLIGGLDYLGLEGIGTRLQGSIPLWVFVAYQGMFAAITPALISGAFAERLKFSSFCLFTLLWSTFVYDPVAHWVWAPEGWLAQLGALDFAGGTVVHLTSGISALVMAYYLGPRTGYPHTRHHPHNLTMTILGAGLLWFGWFGFNAGSALGANTLAGLALVNTHLAAAAGALIWGAWEHRTQAKPTLLGIVSGAIAGLVGITPAAGYVQPLAALAIGAVTAWICARGILLKHRFGYDDSLDAFGVHGLGGICGALCTGLLASKAVNAAGADGLIPFGQWQLLAKQIVGLVAVGAYCTLVTLAILYVLERFVGLRVDRDQEQEGLDTQLHGESAYSFGGAISSSTRH